MKVTLFSHVLRNHLRNFLKKHLTYDSLTNIFTKSASDKNTINRTLHEFVVLWENISMHIRTNIIMLHIKRKACFHNSGEERKSSLYFPKGFM